MSAIEDSMKAAAKAVEATARFCRTMMRLEHPSDCKETREEQFVSDWFLARKMDKEPTYADAIEWADKTMIDKACEWLYVYYPTLERSKSAEDAWDKFKKAMEE